MNRSQTFHRHPTELTEAEKDDGDRGNPSAAPKKAGPGFSSGRGRAQHQREERVKYLCDRLSTTESQSDSTNATPDSTIGPASSTASVLTSQHESFRVDDPGVYQSGPSFSAQSVQASDISQSSIAASNAHSQYNLSIMSQQLTDNLQPLDMPALSEDYQLFSSITSKNHPKMELLPAGLIVAMLQQLKSAASSHCRMLGYCQETTYGKHQARRADQMRRAFWFIYINDKNMSLLQGRPSYLQDSEVDAWYPRVSPDASCRPWDELFILGIKFAKIQGEVYDHLYSATARHSSRVQQEQAVNQLSEKLQSWYIDLGKLDSSQMKDHEVFVLSKKNWDVMYYSALTLILMKATTTDEESGISLECVEAARAGLQSHLVCFSSYQAIESPGLVSESDYASWLVP
ncbi:hypothetical protein NW762_010708 [Fusarium torreyae]|uniref:Xylanolytic transcriptional activator regulatory domain-containing protein n=1 Tax=Fusarium torreyae TaxID=1237075 RepID=A0A9W8RUU2_9HYPO|nr:hypothetical protein NW762_010708 [Fusarium torreyae]